MNRLAVSKAFCRAIACFILVLASCSFVVNAQTNQGIERKLDEKLETTTKPQNPVQEYAENYVFADPKKRKEFLELTAELRCPKCQNQNIADSDAPIAHDMRRKTYQLMQDGADKPEVIDWMKQRYGDFVHYQPPVTPVTIWLWLMPVLFALMMLFFFIRRRKTASADEANDQELQAKLDRADKLLKD